MRIGNERPEGGKLAAFQTCPRPSTDWLGAAGA